MVEATLGDARFFRRSRPYSLAVVASTARGVADELELLLEGVAPLQTAGSNEVSFLDNPGAQRAQSGVRCGAQVQLPVKVRLPAQLPGRNSNSTGSAKSIACGRVIGEPPN